jgi:hypothetical protein
MTSALRPVRAALFEAGRRDSAALLASARAAAAATTASAVAAADRVTAEARTRGRGDAEKYLAIQHSRGTAQARSVALRADRDGHDLLRSAARAAVDAQRSTVDSALARTVLVGILHAVLGAEATVQDCPDGGVIGVAGGRRLDLSLTSLTDRAFDEVLDELADEGAL